MSSRRWAIRTAQVAAAGVALALILAVVVHLAPVRRVALRRVITLLAERFDVVLRANTLDYNLFGLRATLTGVEVAAARTPDHPFITADRLEVAVPRSVLFGAFALDRVSLDNARIDIRRGADGRMNLPEPQADADPGEPQAVPIGRLRIPQLAVAITDETQGFALDLPALALDVGSEDGTLRLARDGRVRAGDVATTISALGGGVTFDGRTLGLSGFSLATPEVTLQTSGALALLVSEPSLDLRFAGQTDLTGLRRLVPAVPALVGRVGAEGTVAGSLSSPRATVRLTSDQLTWDQLTLANVEAALDADADLVRLQQAAAGVAGGRLTGAGEVVLADQRVDLTLGWTDVDLDALTRALGVGTPRPAASATGTATVRGAGSNIQDWTIEARSTLAPGRRTRGQIAVGSAVDLRVADGRWMLNANGTVERVPVQARLGGVLSAESIPASSLAGTVTTSIGDLPLVLSSLRDAGLLDVPPDTITAGRLDAQATLAGTIAAPRLQATLAGRELAAGGLSNLALDATAAGTLQRLDVDARLQQDAANEIRAVGTVFPDAARMNARMTGTLRNTRGLVPDVPFDGNLELDLAIDGPFSGLAAKGTVTATDAAYAGFMLGRLTAALDATATAARVQLDASDLSTRVDAEVGLTGDRVATIDVAVNDAELERLLRDVESPVKVTGRVGLNARATGALADWRRGTAEVDLTRLDASVGELPVRLASPGRVTYRGETIDVASLEAQLGDTRLSVSGRLPASESAAPVPAADALRGLLVGDLTQVIAAVRATGLTEIPEITASGPLALLARVTGTAERPIVAADLDLANATLGLPDLPPIRGEEIRATVANGWLERLVASGEWQESRFRVDARAPLQLFRDFLPAAVLDALPATTGPATLDARVTSITRTALEPFVDPEGLQQIDGQVDASARLETTSLNLDDLRGEVRLDRLDIRLAGLPVTQSEPTRLVFDGGLARVAAWNWTGEGATLDVQGQLGLTDQQAAILAAGRFDLRLLTPFLRGGGVGIAGTLSPRLSISGSLSNPQIDGEALVTDAELRLREPRVVATDLDASIRLTPQEARIESLTGFVNGGTLTGTGRALYGPGVSPSAQLSGTVTGFGIELPEGLRSELNADLTVAITQEEDVTGGAVTGTVTVVRSAYREPLAVVGGLFTALQTERLAAARADPDAFASQLTLDVRVLTDNDIVVDNNLARLQLGGDLRVIGTAAAPSLSGRAVIREGGQLFLGQNVYTIDTGTIDFADPVTIVPDLNVEASTRAGGEDIVLTISGTPDDLSVGLDSSSAPELGDADIASLLLTGRRLDDVSGAEADVVREQVLGYLSGDVLALAGRRVGLDSIRLGGPDTSFLRRDPAAVAAETDPTSRLTFSKDIRHDIELTYSQSLRDGDAQTWIVDYQPITRVNVRFVSDDDDLRAYEFRHDLEIGGAGARRAGTPRSSQALEVTSVTITGETGVPEGDLRRVLRLEQGDRFDFADWQQDHDRLEALLHTRGWLEARVTARRAESADGVALTYTITAGRPTSIVVTGYTPSSRTRQQLEEAWTQSVFDDFLKEEADAIMRAALADAGYIEPTVTLDLVTADTRTLQIAVEPGQRVSRRRLVVEADDSAVESELESWARSQRLDTRWRVAEDVIGPMAAELRARGYLDAEVAANAPRIEDGAAVLTMNVDPGPRFLVGDVTFTGATQIETERLRKTVALEADAPYDPVAVDDARRRVDALYRSEGFASTRVRIEPVVDRTQARVGVVFGIQEGPQQLLQNVTVVGNRNIDTDVITRAMDLPIGEPLSANAWLQSRTRLFDTNLFRRVDVTTEPIEEGSAIGIQPTRLRVAVEEWPALRIRYGLQVAEQRPEDSLEGRDLAPGLSADVTRRTLFGRAVSVGGTVEYQRRQRLVRLFMNSPTTFGLPVQSLLTAERSHRDFAADTLVTDSESIAWEQRVRLHPALQLSYAYRFDRDHTFDTKASNDPIFPPFDLTVNVARLTGSAAFDTRDDPYDSTRGWLLSSSLEASLQSLGSDVSFIRQTNQGYYFRPWRQLVLASAARLGIVWPLGGQALIPSELFFSGGPRSVRGVEEDTLGPRDFFGFPEGGRALLVLNQEARFPIYKWFRGVGFVDAGNVFATPRGIDFSKLVMSYGAGLRIVTPFALLRIDYGRLRENSTAVPGSQWTFGIGHTF